MVPRWTGFSPFTPSDGVVGDEFNTILNSNGGGSNNDDARQDDFVYVSFIFFVYVSFIFCSL
jgi:hypothetical protein